MVVLHSCLVDDSVQGHTYTDRLLLGCICDRGISLALLLLPAGTANTKAYAHQEDDQSYTHSPPTIGSRGMVPVPSLTSGQTRDRHEKENEIHDPVILTFCEGYKYYI